VAQRRTTLGLAEDAALPDADVRDLCASFQRVVVATLLDAVFDAARASGARSVSGLVPTPTVGAPVACPGDSVSGSLPKQDVDAFEAAALKKNGTDLDYVPPRYRSSYFLHIWGNGYAAGYYAYSWTQMLADDGYAWFTEHGGLTRANGDRFRAMVLSRGNTEDLATMYRNWRGRDPDIKAMLQNRGLAGGDEGKTP